jgi:hypothetical protein
MALNTKRIARHLTLVLLAVGLLVTASCSSQPNTSPSTSDSNATPPAAGSPFAKSSKITADPNPIQVCDGSDLGITNLTYTSDGPTLVEVRVGSPNGGLLAHTGANYTATTGKWVKDGSVFYLQDVTDGKPLNAENTLATVTVKLTSAGCSQK